MSKIMLPDVRLAFPSLFVPTSFQGADGKASEPKYKATLLVPKGSKLIKEIEAAVVALATEKWGAKAKTILDSIRGNPNRFCVQDGDLKEYDGFEGHMSVSAGNKVRPSVIDRGRRPLTNEDGVVYAGCYVNAMIEFFTYETPGKGISASLNGIQFVRDGEAFTGGRPSKPEEFPDLSDQGEEEEQLA